MNFEERIKRLIKEIPKGQTLTCLELAIRAGDQKAYQVVENVLKNNKDSDLPCHRVVESFKSLGKYNRDVLDKAHLLYTEGYNFPYKKVLGKDFFNRKTKDVAKDLIGKWLVTKDNALIITEVEVYAGNNDLASHASKGKTQRTKVMFGPAGIWYVYLIYGMYHMLNIVTEEKGFPAAILIRGTFSVSGPGRLTKKLSIDKTFNKKPANKKTGLWIEDRGIELDPSSIKALKRIGVDYAKNWKDKLLRFKYIKK